MDEKSLLIQNNFVLNCIICLKVEITMVGWVEGAFFKQMMQLKNKVILYQYLFFVHVSQILQFILSIINIHLLNFDYLIIY